MAVPPGQQFGLNNHLTLTANIRSKRESLVVVTVPLSTTILSDNFFPPSVITKGVIALALPGETLSSFKQATSSPYFKTKFIGVVNLNPTSQVPAVGMVTQAISCSFAPVYVAAFIDE